jgi:hypothetical protein
MRTYVILLAGLLLICSSASAQYKINKTKYNFKDYNYQGGDPYIPCLSGACSFLCPGLGQMVSGEGARGFAFLGGSIWFTILIGIGMSQQASDIDSGGDGKAGSGLQSVGLTGLLAVYIWSIGDAVRVAKVNNLARRDKNKTGYKIQFSPAVLPVAGKYPVGATLMVRF